MSSSYSTSLHSDIWIGTGTRDTEGNLSKQDLHVMYIYQSAILILVTKILSGAAGAERRERSEREQKAMIDQDYNIIILRSWWVVLHVYVPHVMTKNDEEGSLLIACVLVQSQIPI